MVVAFMPSVNLGSQTERASPPVLQLGNEQHLVTEYGALTTNWVRTTFWA